MSDYIKNPKLYLNRPSELRNGKWRQVCFIPKDEKMLFNMNAIMDINQSCNELNNEDAIELKAMPGYIGICVHEYPGSYFNFITSLLWAKLSDETKLAINSSNIIVYSESDFKRIQELNAIDKLQLISKREAHFEKMVFHFKKMKTEVYNEFKNSFGIVDINESNLTWRASGVKNAPGWVTSRLIAYHLGNDLAREYLGVLVDLAESGVFRSIDVDMIWANDGRNEARLGRPAGSLGKRKREILGVGSGEIGTEDGIEDGIGLTLETVTLDQVRNGEPIIKNGKVTGVWFR